MISIIICSRKSTIPESLIENIKTTIGCIYELIVIDNSKNSYSIFDAYNLGISKSKYDYLCFIHDDLNFLTQDWGIILNEVFLSDNKIGVIGVAGSKYKSKMPSAWWNCLEKDRFSYLVQHFKNKPKELWNNGFERENIIEEVVAVDGVFMAARKDSRIKFNTAFTGFHNYDLNLVIEYIKINYSIVVTNKILLEHFSIGTLNKDWFESTAKLHKYYDDFLPLLVSSTKYSGHNELLEFQNGSNFLTNKLKFGFGVDELFLWFKLILLKPFSKFHFSFFKKLLS